MAEPALEIEGDETQSRRVQRQPRKEDTAEAALATAKKTIEDRDKQVADLQGQVRKTSTVASEQALGRLAERETAITTGLAAAEAAETAGVQALKAARESGDLDQEMKALDQVAEAKLQKREWISAKTTFEANKDKLKKEAESIGKTQPSAGRDSESQKWLDEHPLIQTDAQYSKDADMAHDIAVRDGARPGSPTYFASINAYLERLHGKDHGKAPGSKTTEEEVVVTEQPPKRGTSMSAPAGRGGADGSYTMDVNGKSLSLSKNSEGKDVLRGTIPGAWVEAAKWNKMSPTDYAISQLKIAQEGGGSVTMGEGAVFR